MENGTELARLQALLAAKDEALRKIAACAEGVMEAHAHNLEKGLTDDALWLALRGLEKVATMAQRGLEQGSAEA